MEPTPITKRTGKGSRPRSQPTRYKPEIVQKMCDRIATGGLITQLCELKEFPTYTTFRRWKEAQPEIGENIARARAEQMDFYADEITQLNAQMNAKNWQFTNAKIRNIQWMMGKLKAVLYGDRLAHTGADGGPVGLTVITAIPRPNWDDPPALTKGSAPQLEGQTSNRAS